MLLTETDWMSTEPNLLLSGHSTFSGLLALGTWFCAKGIWGEVKCLTSSLSPKTCPVILHSLFF